MDRAFLSYTPDQISEYYKRVKSEGLTEHGFPRLASNLGILICHERHTELLPLFIDLMDLCCEQMPKVHAANDFSVREVVTCLLSVEKAKIVSEEKLFEWKNAIADLDPWRCYDCIAQNPDQVIGNWTLFNAISEYSRIWGGFVDDEYNRSYIDLQLATQLKHIDKCGMYMDPHHKQPAYAEYVYPILYDYVPRVLLSFLVKFGYNGKHKEAIISALEKSADLTLKMQSVTGEIPFGGRSQQFMHNECTESALLEFYAWHYAQKGDLDKAREFKRAARLAAESVLYWFDNAPMKHVKNRYSIESQIGCEAYAYFDKYMITAASMAYLAYLYSDDEIEESDTCPTIRGGYVAKTSDNFHKYFLNEGGYFVEIETDSDKHYEGSGIGRIQKLGAPPQICLSSGFGDHPSYVTDGKNWHSLSLCSSVIKDGNVYLGAHGVYTVNQIEKQDDACFAEMTCKIGNVTTEEQVRVTQNGVTLTASSNEDNTCIEIPVFDFDGVENTEIAVTKQEISVKYKNSICHYETDGEISDVEETICNRNGRYRRFRAIGNKVVSVKISISIL